MGARTECRFPNRCRKANRAQECKSAKRKRNRRLERRPSHGGELGIDFHTDAKKLTESLIPNRQNEKATVDWNANCRMGAAKHPAPNGVTKRASRGNIKPAEIESRAFRFKIKKPAASYFPANAVSSAQRCLTSVFGMGTGIATSPWPPA